MSKEPQESRIGGYDFEYAVADLVTVCSRLTRMKEIEKLIPNTIAEMRKAVIAVLGHIVEHNSSDISEADKPLTEE